VAQLAPIFGTYPAKYQNGTVTASIVLTNDMAVELGGLANVTFKSMSPALVGNMVYGQGVQTPTAVVIECAMPSTLGALSASVAVTVCMPCRIFAIGQSCSGTYCIVFISLDMATGIQKKAAIRKRHNWLSPCKQLFFVIVTKVQVSITLNSPIRSTARGKISVGGTRWYILY
jgi:hypothetical protein